MRLVELKASWNIVETEFYSKLILPKGPPGLIDIFHYGIDLVALTLVIKRSSFLRLET